MVSSVPSRSPSRRRPAGAPRRTDQVLERLTREYPVPECALHHDNPLQLLVATILSAQCTDQRVNLVTPKLFARYANAAEYALAGAAEMEALVQSTGFFRAKTRSIMGMAQALVSRFDGEVPGRMEDLVTLPGVGRKTANVLLGVAFGVPGLPVDTHVTRLSRRLKLTAEADPVKIETALCAMLPAEQWTNFSLRLILHGRAVCVARTPRCGGCVLSDICPSSTAIGLVAR